MKTLPLYAMAHARSGDKGDGSNVGILAYDARGYEILKNWLTPERVKAHFRGIVLGEVERFERPNLLGLNFLLHASLGGSGSAAGDSAHTTHFGVTAALSLASMSSSRTMRNASSDDNDESGSLTCSGTSSSW